MVSLDPNSGVFIDPAYREREGKKNSIPTSHKQTTRTSRRVTTARQQMAMTATVETKLLVLPFGLVAICV